MESINRAVEPFKEIEAVHLCREKFAILMRKDNFAVASGLVFLPIVVAVLGFDVVHRDVNREE